MAHVTKIKAGGAGAMLDHYERVSERLRGFERPNIDNTLSETNYNLRERDAREVLEAAKEAHVQTSGKALRKDANVMFDWVVTLPKDCPPEKAREFFEASASFMEKRYGEQNVLGAWVHMDETTPHMHMAFVPVINGKMQASKMVNRKDLQSFHGELGEAVDKALGFHVSVELSEEQEGEKELSRLSQKEYIAAQNRLERLRCDVEKAERTAAPESGREVARINREGKLAEGRIGELEQRVEEARTGVAQLEFRARFARDGNLELRETREEIAGRVAALEIQCAKERKRSGDAAERCESLRERVGTLRESARRAVRAVKEKIGQISLLKPNKATQAKLERLTRSLGVASPFEKQNWKKLEKQQQWQGRTRKRRRINADVGIEIQRPNPGRVRR